MRRYSLHRAALIATLAWTAASPFAQADDLATCKNGGLEAKERITVCSRLVDRMAGNRRALATAYNLRGLAYEADDQPEAAFEDFSAAVKLDGKYASAYVNRCDNLLKRNSIAAAIAECTTAIEIVPGSRIAIELRAKAHLQAGDTGSAIRDYDRLIEMRRHRPAYYLDRGRAHLDAGDVAKALADAVELQKMEPSDASYSELLHTIFERYHKDDRVVPLLPAAAVSDYFRIKAQGLLKHDQISSDDVASAEAAANEGVLWANRAGLIGSPRANAFVEKGRVALHRNDTEGALAAFREARVARPSDGEPWLLIAKLRQADDLGARGDSKGALQSAVLAFAELTEAQRKIIGTETLLEHVFHLASAIGNPHGELNIRGTSPRSVTDCDREASHSIDPFRVTPPVPFAKVNGSSAVTACNAALKRMASEPRLLYQRARAYRRLAEEEPRRKRQHLDAFRADMNAALKANYPAAFAVLPGAVRSGEYPAPERAAQGGTERSLRLEALNRYIICCAVAVSKELVSGSSETETSKMRAADALLAWSAELGSHEAHLLLAERATAHTTASAGKAAAAQALEHLLIAKILLGARDSVTTATIELRTTAIRQQVDLQEQGAAEKSAKAWKKAGLPDVPSWLRGK